MNLSSCSQDISRWIAAKQSNGRWVFRTDERKLLARCDGCATTNNGVSSFGFVLSDNGLNPRAQWTL